MNILYGLRLIAKKNANKYYKATAYEMDVSKIVYKGIKVKYLCDYKLLEFYYHLYSHSTHKYDYGIMLLIAVILLLFGSID